MTHFLFCPFILLRANRLSDENQAIERGEGEGCLAISESSSESSASESSASVPGSRAFEEGLIFFGRAFHRKMSRVASCPALWQQDKGKWWFDSVMLEGNMSEDTTTYSLTRPISRQEQPVQTGACSTARCFQRLGNGWQV